MAQSRIVPSSAYLIKAVVDYMLYLNRTTLDHLLMQVKLNSDIFFHDRSQHITLFERVICTKDKESIKKIKNVLGFFANLWQANLNPLTACYHTDIRTLDLCISLLKEAMHAGVLTFRDYRGFYISALDQLLSVESINSPHVFHLLSSLDFDNLTPIAFAIKHFPAHLVRTIFVLYNEAYFSYASLKRENYQLYLTTPDRYGLTALHYALKKQDNAALIDLFATMSLLFTLEEHVQFNTANVSNNSYLDWIAFYGDMEKLNLYMNYLNENLIAKNVKTILFKQAVVHHEMRILHDNDSIISQTLINVCEKTQVKIHDRSNLIFKFKLFSFPTITCDGIKVEEQRRFNP